MRALAEPFYDGSAHSRPGALFYSFDLDAVVPGDHLVRKIAAVLDLSWVHAEMAPHYSAIGRPSIDPDADHRLSVRHPLGTGLVPRGSGQSGAGSAGLSIEDKLPDHSAFSRARNERFRDSDIFRLVFERVVSACIAADLVGGKGLPWMQA